MSNSGKSASRILMVRLGAMGDIVHTLPAAAALKTSFPDAHLTWAMEPRWASLLEGNPHIDRVFLVDRSHPLASLRALREDRYDIAVDFQGLIKSAVVARFSGAARVIGLDRTQAREGLWTSLFYTEQVLTHSAHMVDLRLELAAAAGASLGAPVFPLPSGRAEGDLPDGDFVLASPLAGWRAKQWPLAYYRDLVSLLRRDFGIPVVVDGPQSARAELAEVLGAIPHYSGLAGLIHATRHAAAVIGVDSGPLHIAAALNKPGIAIFGPTDPMRNGPYGSSIKVLRSPHAQTTYRRGSEYDPSMLAIRPEEVFAAFKAGCLTR
jgi:heptosyltransferase-1